MIFEIFRIRLYAMGRFRRIVVTLLPAATLGVVILVLSASCSLAEWELVRSFIGPGGAGGYAVSSFTVSQTVGEAAAGVSGGDYPSGSLFSGYLSQIPSRTLALTLLQFESTAAVSSGGALWGMEPDGSVKLTFSNEISSSAPVSSIVVTLVMDHFGNEINSTAAASVSFSQADNSAEVNPTSGAWPNGSLFAVYYSSGLTDINGLPVLSGTTRYFTTRMNPLQDNVAAVPGELEARVNIPAGAYSQDFLLVVSTSQSEPSIMAANTKLFSLPGGISQPLKVLSANATDNAGNTAQPGAPCVLNFPYEDENGDGYIDRVFPPVRAVNLAVWRLDEAGRAWVKQTGAVIDTASRKVSLRVEHFSSYALLAVPDTDVSLVHAYPVPFRPNAGNPAKYGSWTDLITFTQLPTYGKIRIYALSGEQVRELDIVPPSMKWDLKNSGGETVASGVYIWKVSSGSNTRTGKLMVIK